MRTLSLLLVALLSVALGNNVSTDNTKVYSNYVVPLLIEHRVSFAVDIATDIDNIVDNIVNNTGDGTDDDIVDDTIAHDTIAASAIGWCESRDDYQAQNPVSSASGRYQFIDGTWQWTWESVIGKEPPTPRAYQASQAQQDKAFYALWDEGRGARHWSPSQSCWKDML